MISRPALRSRFPVGSSARISRRSVDQRPSDRDTLLLATRKLGSEVICPRCQAYPLQSGQRAPRSTWPSPYTIGISTFFERSGSRQQIEGLKDEPDSCVANARELLSLYRPRLRLRADSFRTRPIKAAKKVQQRVTCLNQMRRAPRQISRCNPKRDLLLRLQPRRHRRVHTFSKSLPLQSLNSLTVQILSVDWSLCRRAEATELHRSARFLS